jgi:hypothetical protein
MISAAFQVGCAWKIGNAPWLGRRLFFGLTHLFIYVHVGSVGPAG